MSGPCVALYDLKPGTRNVFFIPLREGTAVVIGHVPEIPQGYTQTKPRLMEIDPGRKIGTAGLVAWTSLQQGDTIVSWRGCGTLLHNKNQWELDTNFSPVREIRPKKSVKGRLGAWWGFLIKGYGV